MEINDIAVVGVDLSLNNAGFVAVDCIDGRVLKYGFITTEKKYTLLPLSVDLPSQCQVSYLQPRLSKTKSRDAEDKDLFAARRRQYVSSAVIKFIEKIKITREVLVCLEGYAMSSQSTGLLEMAEVSGLVKNHLWCHNIHLRIHSPLSVKQWATGNVYAKKIHMRIAASKERFQVTPDLFQNGGKFPNPIVIEGETYLYDIAGPGTDVVDSYHLACLGRVELLVRRGMVKLDTLYEGQRKVFSAVSKVNPVSLLTRPFIVNKENQITPYSDITQDGNQRENQSSLGNGND